MNILDAHDDALLNDMINNVSLKPRENIAQANHTNNMQAEGQQYNDFTQVPVQVGRELSLLSINGQSAGAYSIHCVDGRRQMVAIEANVQDEKNNSKDRNAGFKRYENCARGKRGGRALAKRNAL